MLLVLFGAGAIALCAIVVWPESEPSYQGRKLSQWTVACWAQASHEGNSEKSEEAIRQIGTNAVPYLAKWIRYETPAWKTMLRQGFEHVPAKLRPGALYSEAKNDRADSCSLAFAVLGRQSALAVPDLCVLLDKPNAFTNKPPPTFERTRLAFEMLGTNALPEVLQLLTNRTNPHRLGAANALMAMPKDTQTAPIVLDCLQDPDPLVAQAAARGLGEIRLADAGGRDRSISVFTNILARASPWIREQSVRALLRLGMYRGGVDPAWDMPAMQALTNALIDATLPVRQEATNALRWWTDVDGTNFFAPSSLTFAGSPSRFSAALRPRTIKNALAQGATGIRFTRPATNGSGQLQFP